MIRSVFVGLRTRRLGTRGNSKYHYYGIRIKPGSALAKSVDQSQICNISSNNNLSHNNNQGPPNKKSKTLNNSSFNKSNNSNCVVPLTNSTSSPTSATTVVTSNQTQQQQPNLNTTSIEDLKSYLGDPTTLLQRY